MTVSPMATAAEQLGFAHAGYQLDAGKMLSLEPWRQTDGMGSGLPVCCLGATQEPLPCKTAE